MKIFSPDRLLLIAGPCSLENAPLCRAVASVLSRLATECPQLQIVFKGSFDKANRTSGTSPRGPGLKEGLELLEMVRREFALPVLTDIHSPEQAEPVAAVCDVLQIPAFLCRQTDLLEAAGHTKRAVQVKKGQFLAPHDMQWAVKKLEASGASEIWQAERGTTFGYQNLVVDMRGLAIMKAHGHPVVFDATHSVQLPGAAGGQSGGDRRFVPLLARAALAAGVDGLFVETHPAPHQAVSDKETQLPLEQLPSFVRNCIALWEAVRKLEPEGSSQASAAGRAS